MLVRGGVNWTRVLGLGALLLLMRCKADGCGVHFEAGGPRLKTESVVRTRGPTTPIPANKLDYVGVWRAASMRLAIRDDGAVVYYRDSGTGPVSIDSSIQEFRADGFSVGAEPVISFFRVERPPHLDGSDWRMTVDGVELLKIPDYAALARKHMDGDGVPKDESKAAQLLEKGCDHDDMTCCGLLGSFYEHGVGVPKDPTRAAALLTKACAREDLLSCAVLGGYYSKGEGVVRDFVKAHELVSKACSGGDRMGCFNLAVMYDEGLGVANDDAKAAELYAKACDRGSGQACQNLALMCEDGEGIPKDLARANELFQRACKLGFADSCRYIQQH